MQPSSPDQLYLCYVLHRRDYANTSLLAELFARDLGRFPVLAKGAKRHRNPAAGLLQPFQPVLASFTGRGEVKTLKRLEPGAPARLLQGRALFCGIYVNELVMRLIGRGDPHERLFEHYRVALEALAESADQAAVLRRFELRLLEEAGYAMVLEREAESTVPLRPEARYRYDPERGPLLCTDPASVATVSGHTLLALARDETLDRAAAREARDLMRRVLDHHLGGRPVKSRELFR